MQPDENLRSLSERRGGGWLPPLPALTAALEQKSVRALMTTPAIYVHAEATVDELIARALREGVRALPVLNAASQVVGIVTDTDLQRGGLNISLHHLQHLSPDERALWLEQAKTITVHEIMSQPVITVPYYATVATALTIIRDNHLKRLPVVDQTGHLEGILTRSGLLRELLFEGDRHGEKRAQLSPFFNWDARIDEVELEAAVVVPVGTPLPQLLQAMREALQLCAVIVNEEQQVVGIISQSDLLTRVGKEQREAVLAALYNQGRIEDLSLRQSAGDLMTKPVMTVTLETQVYTAIRLLIDNQIKRLPVIDSAGKVVGMVNRRTLLNGLLGEQVEDGKS